MDPSTRSFSGFKTPSLFVFFFFVRVGAHLFSFFLFSSVSSLTNNGGVSLFTFRKEDDDDCDEVFERERIVNMVSFLVVNCICLD